MEPYLIEIKNFETGSSIVIDMEGVNGKILLHIEKFYI